MKKIGILGAAAMALLLAAPGAVLAQGRGRDRGGERGQRDHGRRDENGRGRRAQMRATPERMRQWRTARDNSWRDHRARDFDREHRGWRDRGGYRGYRIPTSYFQNRFGRNHAFRIRSLPYMFVGGVPRFQYDGYWFNVVDPYPEYWGPDWWDRDDVYIDYLDGGYYLFNRRFPNRPGLALSISF